MKTCPSCKRESQAAGEECPYCGLIYAKWEVYMYIDLTQFEASGGVQSMQWILAILYNLFGKWGVVGPMAFALAVGSLKALQMLATGERSLR